MIHIFLVKTKIGWYITDKFEMNGKVLKDFEEIETENVDLVINYLCKKLTKQTDKIFVNLKNPELPDFLLSYIPAEFNRR